MRGWGGPPGGGAPPPPADGTHFPRHDRPFARGPGIGGIIPHGNQAGAVHRNTGSNNVTFLNIPISNAVLANARMAIRLRDRVR